MVPHSENKSRVLGRFYLLFFFFFHVSRWLVLSPRRLNSYTRCFRHSPENKSLFLCQWLSQQNYISYVLCLRAFLTVCVICWVVLPAERENNVLHIYTKSMFLLASWQGVATNLKPLAACSSSLHRKSHIKYMGNEFWYASELRHHIRANSAIVFLSSMCRNGSLNTPSLLTQ